MILKINNFSFNKKHLNHQHLSTSTPVSLHFNQAGHSINDVHLFPIELIRIKRGSVRKAREAHLINKAKTLHPLGIKRRDEARKWHIWHLFINSLPIIVTYFYLNLYLQRFSFHIFFFHSAPEESLYCKPKYRAILFKIKVLYSVLFCFDHIRRWDQCAVYILYCAYVEIEKSVGFVEVWHDCEDHDWKTMAYRSPIWRTNISLFWENVDQSLTA